MSMIKLIYSDSFDSFADIGMRIVEDRSKIIKSASTVFKMEYEELMPDKNHVGIHVTALGAGERYGPNRNFDYFPKEACIKYHDTFVKHGAVFRHHRNKDREKSLGTIKASAYNSDMDRVELFIHVDKEKAKDELERLSKEGEIPFSMACKVPGDYCSLCNAFRKNAEDPNMCDHIRSELGKLREDGKVAYMINAQPDFFDISFVGRPADRIAWNLKVASGEPVDSVKLASASGIWVPDYLAIETEDGVRKLRHLKKMAESLKLYTKILKNFKSIKTASDNYFYQLSHLATLNLDDKTIENLRRYDPKDTLTVLAKYGCVLSPESFFKYALGKDYKEVKDKIPLIKAAILPIINDLIKNNECQEVCNDTFFDVDDKRPLRKFSNDIIKEIRNASITEDIDNKVLSKIAENNLIKISIDFNHKIDFNNSVIKNLTKKYISYKLAAMNGIIKFNKDTDEDVIVAVSAAQNIIN